MYLQDTINLNNPSGQDLNIWLYLYKVSMDTFSDQNITGML